WCPGCATSGRVLRRVGSMTCRCSWAGWRGRCQRKPSTLLLCFCNSGRGGAVAHTLYLCLAEGTDVHATTDGGVAIQGEEFRLVFQQLPTGLRAALQRLVGAGADADTLAGIVSASDGSAGLMRWYYYLQRLDGRGLLRRAVRLGDCPLATLVP